MSAPAHPRVYASPFFDTEAEADFIDVLTNGWRMCGGCGLDHDELLQYAFEAVEPTHFWRPLTRTSFVVLRESRAKGRAEDWSTLTPKLEQAGFTTIGIERFVRYADGAGVAPRIPEYVRRLLVASLYRKAYARVTEVAARLLAGDAHALEEVAAGAA